MFDEILTWETLLLAFGAFFFTWLTRRIVELAWPAVDRRTPLTTAQNVWERLLLPTLPVVFGVLLVYLMPDYAYPKTLTGTRARMLFGAFVGFFSEWVYRYIKQILKERFKVEPPEALP
jgi:hypothetical protein